MISSVVRPCCARRIAFWISSSVALSMALVESSRIRMRGLLRKARARAMRWRCPPLSVTPRSPTVGLIAVGERHDEVVRLRFARRLLDLLLRRVRRAEGDVLRQRAREQEHVLLDLGDLRAQAGQVPVAHVHAVDQDASFGRVVGAVDQLGQRRLARSRPADDGDRLPRRRCGSRCLAAPSPSS